MSPCLRCSHKNTGWTDRKSVGDQAIVGHVCSDCGHTYEQVL